MFAVARLCTRGAHRAAGGAADAAGGTVPSRRGFVGRRHRDGAGEAAGRAGSIVCSYHAHWCSLSCKRPLLAQPGGLREQDQRRSLSFWQRRARACSVRPQKATSRVHCQWPGQAVVAEARPAELLSGHPAVQVHLQLPVGQSDGPAWGLLKLRCYSVVLGD